MQGCFLRGLERRNVIFSVRCGGHATLCFTVFSTFRQRPRQTKKYSGLTQHHHKALFFYKHISNYIDPTLCVRLKLSSPNSARYVAFCSNFPRMPIRVSMLIFSHTSCTSIRNYAFYIQLSREAECNLSTNMSQQATVG